MRCGLYRSSVLDYVRQAVVIEEVDPAQARLGVHCCVALSPDSVSRRCRLSPLSIQERQTGGAVRGSEMNVDGVRLPNGRSGGGARRPVASRHDPPSGRWHNGSRGGRVFGQRQIVRDQLYYEAHS